MSTHVRVETVDGVIEATLLDKHVLDEIIISAIGTELTNAMAAVSPPNLIVSFAAVEHLSSAALGMLITLNNRANEAGGALCLSGIEDRILEVFRITKLDQVLTIEPDLGAARGAMRG
jgi:anti-sigma B factor antagonist